MKSVGDQVHRGTKYAITYSYRRIYTCTHKLRSKHGHAHTGWLLEPCLPCNIQLQHVHGPDLENQTVRLTSPVHSARGQTCFLFTSNEIHLHRLQKHSTSLARVTYLHPCNNSDMYCKEISFSTLSLPRVLFQ